MTASELLAETLGVSAAQLFNWEHGKDRHTGAPCPVPKLVELAAETVAKRRRT